MILQYLEKEESDPNQQAKILQNIIAIAQKNFPRTASPGRNPYASIIPWGFMSTRAQVEFLDRLRYLFEEAIMIPQESNAISTCISEEKVFRPPLEYFDKFALKLKKGHEMEPEEDEYFYNIAPTHIYHYFANQSEHARRVQISCQTTRNPVDYCLNDSNAVVYASDLPYQSRYVEILRNSMEKMMMLNVFLGLPYNDDTYTTSLAHRPRPALHPDDYSSKCAVGGQGMNFFSWHPRHLEIAKNQPITTNKFYPTGHNSALVNAGSEDNYTNRVEDDDLWRSKNIFQDAFEQIAYPVDFCFESQNVFLLNYRCSFSIYPTGVSLQLWKEIAGEQYSKLHKAGQMLIVMRRKMFFKNLITGRTKVDFDSNNVVLTTQSVHTDQIGGFVEVKAKSVAWDGVLHVGWENWVPEDQREVSFKPPRRAPAESLRNDVHMWYRFMGNAGDFGDGRNSILPIRITKAGEMQFHCAISMKDGLFPDDGY